MPKLIVHVGPGKCGSSSIQKFFATQKKIRKNKTRYIKLRPAEIREFNCEDPGKSLRASFKKILSTNLNRCDALILSHEILFKNPHTIRNLCSLAQDLATKIIIIGYSRRQSDFLVSSYSQWLFRSQDRINEVAHALDELTIDPVLFTGLEKQIIASIANDFYSARQRSGHDILDWNKSYTAIAQHVHEFNAEIKCGVLPTKKSDTPLIQDFCAKAELASHSKIKDKTNAVTNPSFNQDIVEAINIAVTQGLEIPERKKGNKIIQALSSQMDPLKKNSSAFLSDLKAYTDTYYQESNQQLCTHYGLDQTYFEPSKTISKPEILESIEQEGQKRSLNPTEIIRNNQILSAKMVELCVKLTKED